MSPTNDRDAGFCSGGSENEEDLDHHQLQMRLTNNNNNNNTINNNSECSSQSPIHAGSEDSSLGSSNGGDRFVLPATPAPSSLAQPKNKRKSSEPIRVVVSELSQCGPIKKRIKLENEKMLAKAQAEAEAEAAAAAETPLRVKLAATGTTNPLLSPDSGNPFRPWTNLIEDNCGLPLNPAHAFKRHPGVTTLHRIPEQTPVNFPQFMSPVQDEPIALVSKKKSPAAVATKESPKNGQKAIRSMLMKPKISLVPEKQLIEDQSCSSTPSLADESNSSIIGTGSTLNLSLRASQSMMMVPMEELSQGSAGESRKEAAGQQQRNYKNMTRERRIEANARERTRVHTISAAFEKLRQSVPAYSNTQKLSKLSVLRIACSYIMSLSRVAGMDYSEDQSEPSIGECVDALTRTIQTEGKLRKKKDD